MCNFTVAVNRRQKDEQGRYIADYFRVSAWDGLAKTCKQYLAKGRKVCVVGQVGVSTYMTQDGTTKASLEVMAQDVEFLTPKGDGYTPVQEQDDPFMTP